jgi:hypothetical protein
MITRHNATRAGGKTLIHVFPTSEQTQQRVLALLRRLTAAVFAPQHGFVGASLAHSVDGERIVMQSEWRELADFRRALRTPVGVAYWQRVRALLSRGGDRDGDVRVYDGMVSFYSLGAVSEHATPPAQSAPISANVF